MLELPTGDTRWHLYRLLSDPTRLRLLALAAEEELAVGELAELLGEPQPNVSRQAAPLRQAGLLADRRQGTRTLIRLAAKATDDAVVADALDAGRKLCAADGSLARVAEVVAHRDAKTREFFSRPGAAEVDLSPELPSYLAAFAGLIQPRDLALDAGTGDGALLDILAPVYRRVVAIDRSEAQLARARQRLRARGYDNVELLQDQMGGADVMAAIGDGADLVVAARVLHHAPRPRSAMSELVRMARPGGRVLVIDYVRHDDERLSEHQADVWLGFSRDELCAFGEDAGLVDLILTEVPSSLVRSGPDAHLDWYCLIGTRPQGAPKGKLGERKNQRKQEKS
jgi:ArsR family transcriptional regulator